MQYDKLKNGLWIVAGDSNDRVSRFQLYFYDIKTKQTILEKNDIDMGYSEGITIVNNNGKRFLFAVEDNGKKPNKAANYILIDLGKSDE
ncbi:hypothetical protein MNB_SM-6-700 [hydrothermal vent metagenome]|uniref:Phytase-like domain-containing protein n=1 Tax=hydrothermal vent metagenome TaxID=652676 RepID=A0A1W1BXV5_9ZZZZ